MRQLPDRISDLQEHRNPEPSLRQNLLTVVSNVTTRASSVAKQLPYYRVPPGTRSTDYTPVSLSDYAWELSKLGLAGDVYTQEQYIQRLTAFLQIEIEVCRSNTHNYPLLKRKIRQHGLFGGLFFELDRRRVWIIIPEHLPEKFILKLIYHELSHLAAGHAVRRRHLLYPSDDQQDSMPKDDDPVYPPWEYPATRTPPVGQEQIEKDADRRANLALKFSFWGRSYWDRPEFYLGLVDQ